MTTPYTGIVFFDVEVLELFNGFLSGSSFFSSFNVLEFLLTSLGSLDLESSFLRLGYDKALKPSPRLDITVEPNALANPYFLFSSFFDSSG